MTHVSTETFTTGRMVPLRTNSISTDQVRTLTTNG